MFFTNFPDFSDFQSNIFPISTFKILREETRTPLDTTLAEEDLERAATLTKES